MKKALLAVFAGIASISVNAQTFKQGVKLTAGTQYEVVTSIKSNMTQEMMGQSMEIPMSSTTTNKLEIKSKTAKGYDAASTNSRVTFSANMMGQDMSYDSDKKEDREGKMGEGMNGMVGKTTTFTVGDNGRVLPESVVKPAETKKADEPSADMMSSMMNNMGLGNPTTSPAFDLFVNDKELKVGDSFTEPINTEIKEGASVKGNNTYTLTDIKDGFARFSISSTMNTENKTQMQGMDMTISTTGKSTGDMLVELATGVLSQKTIQMETTGTVEVQGMSIPITGKTSVSITVKQAK